MNNRFSTKKRWQSLTFAAQGISDFFRTEHNARIHAVCTVIVIAASFVLNISIAEACFLIIVMAMVWAAEIFNTAIEKAMDHISLEPNPHIRMIKDLSAAAVLVTAAAAFIVGALIFIPKILLL